MNKRILITGASRGLGMVAAVAFEDDYEVFTLSRKEWDFLNPETWTTPLPEVDVILHCAGGGLGLKNSLVTAKSLHDLFMVNLGAAAEINSLLLPQMMNNRHGNIIHVCSIASGEAVGSVGYNTVKSALAAYVRSLGREMAPYGIVVTGISPGGFEAPDNAMDRLKTANFEAYREFLEQRLPRGVMGKAEELIPLIKFLASDEASMMGGCVVPIDAGEGHYYS
ncbi:MAG: SDR family NAD(P)-dependent oxidoreductase [Thermodesulfobacteriota bacterium]